MVTTSNLAIAAENTVAVGLGELKVTKDPLLHLACYGLGSCISLCIYDRMAKVAGMVHIVLPESNHGNQGMASAKYADVAVPLLVEEMAKSGAMKSHLVVKLVGGAQMIQAAGFVAVLDMGKRNLEMTRKALAGEGIRISGEEVGGTQGRSVWLSTDSGKVMVRTAGKELKEV